MLSHIGQIECGTGSQHYDRGDNLTIAGIGRGDSCRFRHKRMGMQHILDLPRRNRLAAANDHVFEAVDDCQSPLGIEVTKVAGAKPAVGGERVGIESGIAVTHKLVGPLNHHLTVHTSRLVSARVDHPHRTAGHGRTVGSHPDRRWVVGVRTGHRGCSVIP